MVYQTLGCKLNFAETSSLVKILAESGFSKVKPGEQADVCIINTCTVTETADKKSRQTINRLIRQHPGAFVVVTGCFAQMKAEEIEKIPGVDLILGANEKFDLPALLEKRDSASTTTTIKVGKSNQIDRFLPSCSKGDRTRYFLKVQDGCDYYCTYCTIPFARGKSRNPEISSLVEQAAGVAAAGGKEIVLTGVNMGDFGKSNGQTFLELLKALDEVEGIERYRISSIEPNLLTEEIIAFTASSKKIAPHFHIPLQAGSDQILKLMHRRYDTALFASRIQAIRAQIPHAFIGVDVIVGSRGESETCFEEAYRFMSQLDVNQFHVFSYSERPGTMALQIEPVVSGSEKKVRSARIIALSDAKWRQFYQSQVGRTVYVLFEHTKINGMMHGFSENYVRVSCPYNPAWINRLMPVQLGGFADDGLSLVGKVMVSNA